MVTPHASITKMATTAQRTVQHMLFVFYWDGNWNL